MSQHDPKLIEKPITLPQSRLWELQSQYYRTKGISAWDDVVPLYITSNAYIGTLYAEQCVAFMQDWCKEHPEDTDQRFTFLEIASGTGLFAFYFLRAMNNILQDRHFTHINFQLILTDLAEKNVSFYESNPVFAPFVAADQLDFGCFNVEKDADVQLKRQQKPLSACLSSTPLILIGNYALDSTRQDIFEFSTGKVENVWLGLRSRYNEFDAVNAEHLDELRFDYEPRVIQTEGYYPDPAINQIFQRYVEELKNSRASLLLPLGGFDLFKAIDSLSKGRYFAIMGDKGDTFYYETHREYNKGYSTFHGIHTFPVNFQALAWYVQQQQGDVILSTQEENFKVNLFFKGIDKSALVHTQDVFKNRLEIVTPDNYEQMYDEYFTSSYRFNYGALMGYLKLSQWDPVAFEIIYHRLLVLLPGLSQASQKELRDQLNKVEDNLYPIKMHEDAYVLLAILYASMNQSDKAIALLQRGLKDFPKSKQFELQLGIMLDKQRNYARAIVHYQNALTLDPKNKMVKNRLAGLTGKFSMTPLVPLIKAVVVFACLGASLYLLTR